MQFTIGLPTDHVDRAGEFVTGEAVTACASAAEAAGFDACFVTDHPAPDAKWLAGGGHHALDPFVALSFAAAATTRLRVQTHILVLPYRNPLLTAKSVLEPRRAVGRARDPRCRARIPEAGVRGARRRLRRAQRADRRSDRRDAPGVDRRRDRDGGPPLPYPGHGHAAPVPARPHPPIWIGGNSTAAMRRAAERGQGWVPFPNPGGLTSRVRTPELSTLDELGRRIAILREHAAAIGRTEPIDICFSPFADDPPAIVDELHTLDVARSDVGGAPPPERDHPRRLDRRGPAARRCRDRSVPRSRRPELVTLEERRRRSATFEAVTDYVIPEPEPKPIDETTSMELRILSDNAVLKGRPSGDEKCQNCRYYLEPTAHISYCWHPKLRILVGDEWWCQWWDAIPDE